MLRWPGNRNSTQPPTSPKLQGIDETTINVFQVTPESSEPPTSQQAKPTSFERTFTADAEKTRRRLAEALSMAVGDTELVPESGMRIGCFPA